MATIIPVNGEAQYNVEPRDGESFQLDELQAIVGGYIEIVATTDGRTMVINEEGKLNGLPINHEATLLYINGSRDPIVGDVLVCLRSQVE